MCFKRLVPLFWSQSPQRRKPVPVLDRTREENRDAMQAHFNTQKNKYGKQVLVSLVEQSGREAIVGSTYVQYVINELNDPLIKFQAFDIHQGDFLVRNISSEVLIIECRGMKYENVSKLIDILDNDILDIG